MIKIEEIPEKKQKIKNESYRKFLDEGIIDPISETELKEVLKEVKGNRGKYKLEARALIILLFYSGARPVEVLDVKAKDVIKKGNYVLVKIRGSKRGLPRTIYLPTKKNMVKEFYEYSESLMPEMWLFFHYRTHHIRKRMTPKGELKIYNETTDGLRYFFKKWFSKIRKGSIPPYFLRHNRFSRLAENGVDLNDIRMVKGCRTLESVMPYLHLSSKSARNVAKKLD